MTKAALQERCRELEAQLDLLHQDYDAAIDSLERWERRHILVKVHRDGVLVDAVVIPPSGAMSSPIVCSLLDVNDYVEIYTEVVK